jgi:A/G-specific adenine glycosylase
MQRKKVIKEIDVKKIRAFQAAIWRYYRSHKRAMPWRDTRNPYKILVSEIMLQQTRVSRVMEKYPLFIKTFPNVRALALASPRAALSAWQGLGYNRRALLLKKCAEIIVREYGGELPHSPAELAQLPGIGKATAGAIAAFAFDVPTPFIETNIRRVFIHFFFSAAKKVRDKEILKLVEKTVDPKNPREWYYALMDYGAMLVKTVPNPNKKSAHYARQPRFSGSDRELRGKIIRFLLLGKKISLRKLARLSGESFARVRLVCNALQHDGLVQKKMDTVFLS